MRPIFTAAILATAAIPATAHTVLLHEDFQTETWMQNFSRLDLDEQAALSYINPIFMNPENGASEPWWTARDASASVNRYLVSHSAYNPAGQSNDWLCSGPLTIPTRGFVLTFEAQSLAIRGGEHGLSDLELFITEQPVTKDWQPEEATETYKDVPAGEDIENCDGEFITCTVNLDEYAGKTVYISFANRNYDKDILAIDNVLVQRLDPAEMTASGPAMAVQGKFEVNADLTATLDEGISNWKVTFESGDIILEEEGARLAKGDTKSFTFEAVAEADKAQDWTVTLTCDDAQPIVCTGSTMGLLFKPDHKVLLEETTGVKCTNCPLGIYTIEQIEANGEIGGNVIPVSIHMNVSGDDPMSSFVEDYCYMFGVSAAPAFRMERGTRVLYTGVNDYQFDIEKPSSLGYTVAERVRELTFADLEVTARYIEDEGETKIDATVELTPAITIDGSRYKIGMIVVENNVHLDGNQAWFQENGSSGAPIEGNLGGWTLLPSRVPGVHYQDVARACYGYRGITDSTPDAPMAAGEPYNFNVVLSLPNTYGASHGLDGQLVVNSPEMDLENVEVVAYLIDTAQDNNIGVVNAAKASLSSNPPAKFNTADLCRSMGIDPEAGVDSIGADSNLPAEYFTIDGIRVTEPAKGLYIVRRGNKVTKELIR